ncbi:MAG: hypothetical protein MMC23_008256 [Stictis urceolatum]|nr:hypothetical protein [Stictis urceolata]
MFQQNFSFSSTLLGNEDESISPMSSPRLPPPVSKPAQAPSDRNVNAGGFAALWPDVEDYPGAWLYQYTVPIHRFHGEYRRRRARTVGAFGHHGEDFGHWDSESRSRQHLQDEVRRDDEFAKVRYLVCFLGQKTSALG